MRLLDRDTGIDLEIGTAIFKLISETKRFSDKEMVKLESDIQAAIENARMKWLTERLPLIVGPENAETLKKAYSQQKYTPS